MPPAPPFNLQRTLWPTLALLAVALVVFETTNLDLALQDHFYDFTRHRWLIDAKAPLPRFFFYNLPKVLLILFGLTLIALTLGPARWRNRFRLHAPHHRRAMIALLATLASGPALIALGKATTNTFCPAEVHRYGGDVPYVRALECFPPGEKPARRGRCFPAGHASGGFSLLALAAFASTRRQQLICILIGLTYGWTMGLYQMLKGAHYLSHTVVTMLLIWIIFLLWHRLLRLPQPSAPLQS